MENKKIYFTGLRGVACIMVVLHHIAIKLYPASYLGQEEMVLLSANIELWLAQSAGAFFLNGNFWVMVFMVLSGFVLSLGMYKRELTIKECKKIVLSRYLRLALPIFVYSIMTYIFVCLGLNRFEYYIYEYSYSPYLISGTGFMEKGLLNVLWQGLVGTILFGNASIRGAYWVMRPLFMGVFLLIILTGIIKSDIEKKSKVVLIIIGVIVAAFIKPIYLGIMGGNYLAYRVVSGTKSKIGEMQFLLLFVFGIFLAGYPSGVIPTNYYSFLYVDLIPLNLVTIYHVSGALLLLGLMLEREMFFNRGGESKVLKFIDKISFSVYLIHHLVISFPGLYIMAKMLDGGMTYNYAALISVIAIMIITLVMAYISYIIIEALCVKVVNKIYTRK